jgi:gas vesicle protein
MYNRNYDDGTWDATGCSAFMAGALIGAGVALLFAPQPGEELRNMLRSYANRAKDDLLEKGQEAWDTAVERGREYYDKGEEVIRDAGRSAEEFAQQGAQKELDAVKDAGRAAKEFAKQTQDMIREPGRSAL